MTLLFWSYRSESVRNVDYSFCNRPRYWPCTWRQKLKHYSLVSRSLKNGKQNMTRKKSQRALPESQRSSAYRPASYESSSFNESENRSALDSLRDDFLRSEQQASFDEDNLWCPRCGDRMTEPRLLACLHPICTPCVNELFNQGIIAQYTTHMPMFMYMYSVYRKRHGTAVGKAGCLQRRRKLPAVFRMQTRDYVLIYVSFLLNLLNAQLLANTAVTTANGTELRTALGRDVPSAIIRFPIPDRRCRLLTILFSIGS